MENRENQRMKLFCFALDPRESLAIFSFSKSFDRNAFVLILVLVFIFLATLFAAGIQSPPAHVYSPISHGCLLNNIVRLLAFGTSDHRKNARWVSAVRRDSTCSIPQLSFSMKESQEKTSAFRVDLGRVQANFCKSYTGSYLHLWVVISGKTKYLPLVAKGTFYGLDSVKVLDSKHRS